MTTGGLVLRPGKFLVFRVGEERYALPLAVVREVIAMTHMTQLPAENENLSGVFNLRGKILSVADLRNKLGTPSTEARSKKPCIIAIDVCGLEVANIVDDVLEVVAFTQEQLSQSIGEYSFEGVFKDYILGVAKTRVTQGEQSQSQAHGRLTVILDIEKLLDLKSIQKSQAA